MILFLLAASAFGAPNPADVLPPKKYCTGIECMVGMSESKLDPCATNIQSAKVDVGGLSIGAYQFSSRYGNAQAFMEYMAIDMVGVSPAKHPEAYAARFKAVCKRNPDYFMSEQTYWLLNEWQEWKRARKRYEALYGVSEAIQALALSVVISHGYEGSKPILVSLRGAVPRLTERELAYEISNKRACDWLSKGSRFEEGWMRRAQREYRWVLRALGEEPEVLRVNCDG